MLAPQELDLNPFWPERVDFPVASGARDEGSHLEIAGADREVEVSFNVLTESGCAKRIGSMGMKSMTDQRMGKSQVGSKRGGVGWVGKLDERPRDSQDRVRSRSLSILSLVRFRLQGFSVAPFHQSISQRTASSWTLKNIPTKSDAHRLPRTQLDPQPTNVAHSG